jgi:hypothetical protein
MGDDDLDNPFPDPVEIEITDVFDLHTIPPRDVKAVVEEYLRLAHEKGFKSVRIIHGKGIGVQRNGSFDSRPHAFCLRLDGCASGCRRLRRYDRPINYLKFLCDDDVALWEVWSLFL